MQLRTDTDVSKVNVVTSSQVRVWTAAPQNLVTRPYGPGLDTESRFYGKEVSISATMHLFLTDVWVVGEPQPSQHIILLQIY